MTAMTSYSGPNTKCSYLHCRREFKNGERIFLSEDGETFCFHRICGNLQSVKESKEIHIDGVKIFQRNFEKGMIQNER